MHRFFCPLLPVVCVDASSGLRAEADSILSDEVVFLDLGESHHASKVLRLREGDEVEVFDGSGGSGRGVIEQVRKDEVSVRVRRGTLAHRARRRPEVWVAAAVAKGSRPEEMVNQLSQVGATGWLPVLSERSVVHPRDGKVDKLRRAAVAAAKQARRDYLLEVREPVKLSEALAEDGEWARGGNGAASCEGGARRCVRLWATTQSQVTMDDATFEARLSEADRVVVYIGPEGGWSEREQAMAAEAGVLLWSMGDSIMRIETAAVAAAAIVGYLTNAGRTMDS